MSSQRVVAHNHLRDSRLAAPSLPAMSLFVVTIFTPFLSAVERARSRYLSRITAQLVAFIFAISLLRHQKKLGDRSFKCLVHAVLEHFLILTESYAILTHFLTDMLKPLIDSDPKACDCFLRLQIFALKNALAPFLYELMRTGDREEAIKLALWFHRAVILRKRGKKGPSHYSLIKDKFAIVFIGPRHWRTNHMHRTLSFVAYAIDMWNVKRIHVLAVGRNMIHAKKFEGIILKMFRLEKKFEKVLAVIGERHPEKGLCITLEI